MEQVIDFLADINICYIILNILLLLDLVFYLKQINLDRGKRNIIMIGSLVVSVLGFYYFNGVFNSIFDLKYLSVKCYLLMLEVVNIIALITINKRIRISYSILNYTLFILMVVIFWSLFVILLGNIFPKLYIMDVSNVVTLIDLSFVIFIIYLIGMSLIYIGYCLFANCMISDIKNFFLNQLKGINFVKKKNNVGCVLDSDEVLKNDELANILTEEELLKCRYEDNFYINGVDCSIIFEDSVQSNIIKNYHILLDDINAKMVNGFTLEENQLLKSICMKLQVGNLNNIDIDNIGLLNLVSVEEYNFLKKIMDYN